MRCHFIHESSNNDASAVSLMYDQIIKTKQLSTFGLEAYILYCCNLGQISFESGTSNKIKS